MPKRIQMAGVGVVEFPDDATADEIKAAAEERIPSTRGGFNYLKPLPPITDSQLAGGDEYVSHPALPLPAPSVASPADVTAAPTVAPSREYDYLPPLPPITDAQLAGRPPQPSLLNQGLSAFNRLFEPSPVTPTEMPMAESDRLKLANAVNRVQLREDIGRVTSPVSTGLRESAAQGVRSLASPSGLAITGATVAAPEFMLPAIFASTVPAVPETIARIQKAREEGDRAGYYSAIGDLLQEAFILTGTGIGAAKGRAVGPPALREAEGGVNPPLVAAAIAEARAKGPSPEFRSFFGGIDPEVAGTTPEAVAAFAKSLGMEWRPSPKAGEPPPEAPAAPETPIPKPKGPAPAAPAPAPAPVEPVTPTAQPVEAPAPAEAPAPTPEAPKPAPARYPNTGVGAPADEFGAMYGPTLTPAMQTRFQEQVGESFDLPSTPGTTTTLKVKPHMLWMEVNRRVPGAANVYETGVAYMNVRSNGETVLDASKHGRDIDKQAAQALLDFLGKTQGEKPAIATPPAELPAPAPVAKAQAERPPDIIDEIQGRIGKLSLTAARAIRETLKPTGASRKLFSRTGGNAPDVALDALHREGLFRNIETEDAFLQAIEDAASARKGQRKAKPAEGREVERQTAQRRDFESVALAAQRGEGEPTKTDAVNVGELLEGDEFQLAGAKVKVKELVTDTETGDVVYVVLEDGRRFEEQTVGTDRVIYPDKGTLKSKPAEAPAKGELFPQSTPFNLVRERVREAKPATPAGSPTLAQTEMFDIQKVTSITDPEKSANVAQELYGGPAKAVERLVNQLRVIDSDREVAKSFMPEQRARLREVIALLQQRAKEPPAPPAGAAPAEASPTSPVTEPTVPDINLRESESSQLALGKIKANDPQRWANIVKFFRVGDKPAAIAKAAQARLTELKARRVPEPPAGAPPSPFFPRRSEAQGLGEPSTAPTVEDVRRQRELNREGTPVPPSVNDPTPPPAGPPEAALDLPGETEITDAIRRQDVMPGRDWIASPEFEFRKNPVGAMLVTRVVEAELKYQGDVARDIKRFKALKKGLKKPQQVAITAALRAAQEGDTTLLDALPAAERTVASEIRRYFDDVRQAIIAAKQADLLEALPEARAAAVHDILGGMDEADAFRAHRLRAAGQAAVRAALHELEELEHWGLEDYITNIERGSYKIVAPDGTIVAIAETRAGAHEKALRYARENPGVTRLTVTDEFLSRSEFPTKLTRGQYFRMAARAARALGTDVAEIQQMLRAEGSPIVVVKPPSKFAGPMQHRYGILKGEDNVFDVLPAYAYSVRKKLALDPVFKQARTDLTKLPPNMQKQVEELLADVRGRYSLPDQIADYLLAPIGTKPFAFSRGVGVARTVVANLKLGWRPTAALVNRLGGLQHTWTKAGSRYWVQGRAFLKTPEFREIWHRNADLVGATAQAFLEAGHSQVPWWHPLAMFQYAEKVNRPEAFASFYKYAEGEMGLSGAEAEAFARNSVRFAQFTYTVASLPRILRNPIGRIVGQFKAYLVKEMEFVASVIMSPQWKYELPRYISAFLLMGGPRAFIYFLKSLPVLGAIGALWALEDWLNRKAPRASRGVPGYLGIDITPAVTPQLPSKPSDWLGPLISDSWKLWDTVLRPALEGQNRDFSDLKDWGTKLAPSVAYWARMLEAIGNREGWITDDQGRPLYKPSTADKVKLAFGAKPLEQSVQELDRGFLNHINDVAKANRTRLIGQIINALDKGDGATLDKLLKDAADYGIDTNAIREAAKQRLREPDERLRRRLLKSVRVQEAERLSQPPTP